MKKICLFAGVTALMLASCSTDEQASGGYVAGGKVTLNASLPNSGTRVNEAASDTYGLITNWSSDDSLDVLVNTDTIVSMTKSSGNTFTATPTDITVGTGFNAGKTIYGVNNKSNDKITTAHNGSQLKATLDFTGQDGTATNLSKYDLMYGKGDPTDNITFNHKVCVLRLDINSDSLKADGITSITGMKLKYVVSSGTQLFASREVYNFGATCDSTVTDADSIYIQNTSIPVVDGKATVYIAVPHRRNLFGTLYIKLNGSDGTKDQLYDLTNAISMSNGRMLMSTVHPQAITALSRTMPTLTTANIGDYLFRNGFLGSLAATESLGSTPIAVVFSKTTSATDQGHGWTHGYAMALKNASTNCKWGPADSNPTGTYITTTEALIADKDGYTHTQYINSSTYPVAYAAATKYNTIVTAPNNTSGWYLPSIGQWYDICVNLGKESTTGYADYGNSYLDWRGASSCANNINAYLTPLLSGTYDILPWTSSNFYFYGCSSEYDSTRFYCVRFDYYGADGYVNLLNGDSYNKIKLSTMSRGVIAF